MNIKNTLRGFYLLSGVIIGSLVFLVGCEEDDSFNGNIPAILSFSPEEGKAGTEVTIAGTKLSGATEVRIGDVNASIVSNSDTSITISVPEGALPGNILMINAEGASRSRNIFNAIVEGAAELSGVSDISVVPGDEVIFSGSLFSTVSGVKIGGVDVSSFEIIADDQLKVVVGDSPAGNSVIEIINNAGSFVSDITRDPFYVLAFINPAEYNENFELDSDDDELIFTTGSDAENLPEQSGWSPDVASFALKPNPIDGNFYMLGGVSDTGDSGSYAGQIGCSEVPAGTFSEFFAGANSNLSDYYFNIQINFQGIPDDYEDDGLLVGLRVRFDVPGIDVDGDNRTTDQLMEYRGSVGDLAAKGYFPDAEGWYSISIPFDAFLNPGESGATWADYNVEENVTRFAVAARREHDGAFSMSIDNIEISKGGPVYVPNN